jgi:hypothetical protein
MASNVDIKSLLQQSHEQAQKNLATQVAENRDSGSNKRYSDVDDTYISTFLRDADGFLSRETQNYNEMTYSAAISQQGKQERRKHAPPVIRFEHGLAASFDFYSIPHSIVPFFI